MYTRRSVGHNFTYRVAIKPLAIISRYCVAADSLWTSPECVTVANWLELSACNAETVTASMDLEQGLLSQLLLCNITASEACTTVRTSELPVSRVQYKRSVVLYYRVSVSPGHTRCVPSSYAD